MEMRKMTEYIQVFTTVDDRKKAEVIAKAMVEKRLAACVQIAGPVTSTYRWKEQIETTDEWLLIMKTREGLYAELEKNLNEMHSYDVPEILAVPVTAGSSSYLDWISKETGF
jgi:periplasmic divalent cation tolerance protein